VYLGSPQITSIVDPFDWFPEEYYWSGLYKAPSDTHENYRGALRDINGDFPFTQTPLKVVEVLLQVADKQRRLAGPRYDGRVVRVEGQLDVAQWWGMSLTFRLKRTGEIIPPKISQPALFDEMTCPSGWTLRTSDPCGRMRLYGLCKTGC